MRSVAAQLEEEDARLDAEVQRRSLRPGSGRATSLRSLAETLALFQEPAPVQEAMAAGLCAWTQGQREHFPENIFWDLDYPVACILRQVKGARPEAQAARATEFFDLLLELQRRYGRHSTIRFRYVHDFTYGFDWAKWVGREPGQTGAVGPFDWGFLTYLRRRAIELVSLIERDDRTYPTLVDDRPRNPFSFRRDPEAEQAIFEALAREGELPVETWRVDAEPRWDRPFQQLRVSRAAAQGYLVSEGEPPTSGR